MAVNLLAIADAYNEDAQNAVLDAGDDSPVPNAVLPKGSQLGAFEGLTNAAWLVELGDTAMQKGKDAGAVCGSILPSSRSTAGSSSTFHAIALHQLFERHDFLPLRFTFLVTVCAGDLASRQTAERVGNNLNLAGARSIQVRPDWVC